MFGYVVANYAQLTPEQTARYRGCYCGLCRTLGQRYGLRGRAALTYDMTFLVLLLSSLYEPEETHGTERCALHPAKPHGYWYSEITDYAADMNLALAYYSCLDNWRDDHSLPHLAEARLLEKNVPRCAAGIPGRCGRSSTGCPGWPRWSGRRAATSTPPPAVSAP